MYLYGQGCELFNGRQKGESHFFNYSFSFVFMLLHTNKTDLETTVLQPGDGCPSFCLLRET